MSKAKDFYSISVPEAIRQACDDFGTSQEKLEIEVLETGSKGIFGLCKKRAHIRVSLKKSSASEVKKDSPETRKNKRRPVKPKEQDLIVEEAGGAVEEKPAAMEKPEPGRGPAAALAEKAVEPEETEMPSDEVLESIRVDIERILTLMGFASGVTLHVDGQSVQCNIKGDYEQDLVGQDGRTLDSLQYVVRKMASSRLPDRVTVDLDVGNFREERMQELQKMARELAEQVKETGKTMSIPALNPSERRVVHVALQDDKKIRSRSVGEGIFKKILIFKPGSKGRKSGGRRRGRQGGGSPKQ
ncbi:MAG: Jag N-terminal domain-containing protein [Desulfobulbaceae bacterium]|nr:Jag N-terminal domain-containing protein [Desulfobulbaceae bacterium]